MKDEIRNFRRGGFTVIEMLVVVSIIVILASVVIAVGVAVKTNSQRAQTKVTLKAMMALYSSYVQETGTTMAASDTDPSHFISIARQMPLMQKSINALQSAINYSNSTVTDGFGNLIVIQPTGPRAPYFQSYGPDGVASADDMFSYDP